MEEVQRKSFGARLRAFRREADLTQTELAEIVGVKLRTVQRWEKGEKAPGLDALKVLSNYFQTEEFVKLTMTRVSRVDPEIKDSPGAATEGDLVLAKTDILDMLSRVEDKVDYLITRFIKFEESRV